MSSLERQKRQEKLDLFQVEVQDMNQVMLDL